MDISNIQLVGASDDLIRVLNPISVMTKEQALIHAAWLVALADDGSEFEQILGKVLGT